MWFKHRAWIPIAWLLCLGNVGAVWFAARPAEPWHATAHALFAVLFGLGAQRLSNRRQALESEAGKAELPADITALREDFAALRLAQSEILNRVEQSVDAVAIELERVGEGQRFLTKRLADLPRSTEAGARSQPGSNASRNEES